ncbi:LysR family transcriptional regulator [Thalassotalea euphylliae]|uniref:LysR family transcriptional regulator n=1 Tax=Thalassotalea euphylliae TaxID=1655234 RepID=UPI003644063A
MNTDDLEKFISLAQSQNMQQSAAEFDVTPSAMSKALRRIELLLSTQLFLRSGKQLILNAHGRRFLPYALAAVKQIDEAQSLIGNLTKDKIKVVGPSILLSKWASVTTRELLNARTSNISFESFYEQQSLESLLQGNADIAIVTREIEHQIPDMLHTQVLGEFQQVFAVGKTHAIVGECSEIGADQLAELDFAVPERSPFCGEQRGRGCDGWLGTLPERKMPITVNDHNVLLQLIKTGGFVAIVPDYWAREHQLVILPVVAEALPEKEDVIAVAWQQHWLDALC